MLAVFEKAIGNPPQELGIPCAGLDGMKTGQEIRENYCSLFPASTVYNLSKGVNFMALSHENESPLHPRSIVVIDNIICIFNGSLENMCELRRHYGISRATEAMVVVEAYRVLRDRAPYPPDQVVRHLQGKFAFLLYDANFRTLFAARDREASVEFRWGMAGDGSLVWSDDPKIMHEACGKSCAPFPPGCIFRNGSGLMSFDHPLNKMRAVVQEEDGGGISGVIFQVDLYSRLPSIPRTSSDANWADAPVLNAE